MDNGIRTKVKAVQGAGTYENEHGTDLGNGKKGFYKFEYTMEDGVTLTAMHKVNKPFDIGADVEYTVTGENDYGKRGKVAKPSDGGNTTIRGGAKNDAYVKGIEVGHAVNNAVNMICAGVDLLPGVEFKTQSEKITAYAVEVMRISDELKQS